MAFKAWWGHQHMVGIICPPWVLLYLRDEMEETKTWWGPHTVTMPTGAPVESRFKKDLNLQRHFFGRHKSLLDKTTLELRNKNWDYLSKLRFSCTTILPPKKDYK